MTSIPIPSISIEGLLAARDAAIEVFQSFKSVRAGADAQLRPFGVEMPRVMIHCVDGTHLSLDDDRLIAREVDRHVWEALFHATNVGLLMDSETRRKFYESLHGRRWRSPRGEDADIPEVSAENLALTWSSLTMKRQEFFENAIESIARKLSWDYKTNKPGAFTETIIVSGHTDRYEKAQSHASLWRLRSDTMSDLEQVLAILDKQPPPTHGVGWSSLREVPWGTWTPIPYVHRPLMSVKCFKNGNTHVRILNSDSVRAMNAVLAKRYPGQLAPHRGGAA